MNRSKLAVFAAALLLGASSPLRADIWSVDDDGGPGIDFTSVQDAVDAALPGDVIRVHGGTYASCVIDKGVAVVAVPGGDVQFSAFEPALVTIRDIPVGQTAVLAGVRVPSVLVQHCTGAVVLDEIDANGSFIGPFAGMYTSRPALRVNSSNRVTVSRSVLHGQNDGAPNTYYPWSEALSAVASTVILSQCELEGGRGGAEDNSVFADGRPGGPAVHAEGSRLFVHTSLVEGGIGGDAYREDFFGTGDGGAGAPAFLLDATRLEAFGGPEHRIVGGRGGEHGWIGTGYGPDAPAIEMLAGSTVVYGGVTLETFDVAPLISGFGEVVELDAIPVLTLSGGFLGHNVDLLLEGQSGAAYVTWASLGAKPTYLGAFSSPFLLATPPLVTVDTGTLDADGTARASRLLPAVPELTGLRIQLQSGVQPLPFGKQLSTTTSFVLR